MLIQTYQVQRVETGALADHSFLIFIRDLTGADGDEGLPNLVFNSAGLVCNRLHSFMAPIGVALVNLPTPHGTRVNNGFAAKDNTLTPGWYRFDPNNDYFDDFEGPMIFEFRGATNMETTRLIIEVQPRLATAFNAIALEHQEAGSMGLLLNELATNLEEASTFWRPNCAVVYDHTLQRIMLLGYLERAGHLYQNALSATFSLYAEGTPPTLLATVTNNTAGSEFWAEMENVALNPDNAYMMRFSITDAESVVHLGGVGVVTLD